MLSNNKASAADEFKRILNVIAESGLESKPRGQKVRETFMEMLTIDPLRPMPDFKERQFNFKYFAGEICWYLSRERSIDKIQDFSSFWKNITNQDGIVNSNYGSILFGKQLRWVYDSLCKDKNTRQAIAFLNEPKYQYEGNKDFVCTLNLLFFIRDNKLNMRVNIRSNDLIFGYSYDAPFFAFVLQDMYLWLKSTVYPELKLGTYFHFADNIHYYERHFDLVNRIRTTLDEKEKIQPYFELKKRMFDIEEDGTFNLRPDTIEFCKNVQKLAKEKVTYEPYINELRKFFEIETTSLL